MKYGHALALTLVLTLSAMPRLNAADSTTGSAESVLVMETSAGTPASTRRLSVAAQPSFGKASSRAAISERILAAWPAAAGRSWRSWRCSPGGRSGCPCQPTAAGIGGTSG